MAGGPGRADVGDPAGPGTKAPRSSIYIENTPADDWECLGAVRHAAPFARTTLLVKVPQDTGPACFRQMDRTRALLDTRGTPGYNLSFLTPATARTTPPRRSDRGV